MSRGHNENLGFLSRMSELELRLKQSEDERLDLEKKFNKLLKDRKSQEEMHLYMLRENYSHLLRQDKMRCDRNDMILQTLTHVESRASMLTAKTDRLRLLRQHLESSVNRHYPVLKKGVGRYRSVESLVSNTNESTYQRSASSSPRLMSSYSPSPFLCSPSITRRNSLVISNSEIQDPFSYKVPNRLNLSFHSSRRRLFEDSQKQEKSVNSKTTPFSYNHSENDKKENILNSNTVPTFILSPTDHSEVKLMQDSSRISSDLFLDIPSHRDFSEQNYSKESNEFPKSEKAIDRNNQPVLSDMPRKYDRLSPSRSPVSYYPSKSITTKPLTKSSSFTHGTGLPRNFSNLSPSERRQSSLIRRPSFVYQKANSSQSYSRFQTPKTTSFSYTSSEMPSIQEKYYLSGRSKLPISERVKYPLGNRDTSPAVIKSKSPLTVVDDIFKKYLINYDRRYLTDPISESKYGKYLQPSSYCDRTFTENQSRNKFSNLMESKYDGRTSYLDDISISSRESLGSTSFSKTYGSQDSLSAYGRSPIFHGTRNLSYSDDKSNWKEWTHYKNRYEYPSRLASERPFTKSTFADDEYYSYSDQNIGKELNRSTSYHFLDDSPPKYSYPLNLGGESYEYDDISEASLETPVISKGSLIPHERRVSGKQNLSSKDTFKTPQTPKKVSFSNEFLYDDKSDTETSSNVDKAPIPFDCIESSEITTDYTKTPYKDNEKILTDGTLEAKEEVSPTKYTEKQNKSDEFYLNSDELNLKSDGKEFNLDESDGYKNNTLNIKNLEFTDKKEEEKIFESREEFDACNPNAESNIDQYEKDLRDERLRQATVENKNVEKEDFMEEDTNRQSSSEPKDGSIDSKTTEIITSDPENGTFSVTNEILSAQNNANLGNGNLSSGKDTISHSLANQDTEPQKYGSTEYLQNQKPADVSTYDELQPGLENGSNEEQQSVYKQEAHEQTGSYDSHTPQQFHDPNSYNKNPDVSEYLADLNREQYDQPHHQYDQYNPQKEDYIKNDAPRYDNTQDVAYGPETDGSKDYQQPEVYSGNQYEQQGKEYEKKGFKGSQQSIQEYPQSVPQQQYEDDRYINQDSYIQHDQKYPPKHLPEGYVVEQPYEGEYPPENPQQPYDPNYQDPAQVPQDAPEQYNAEYQDNSQYEYNQAGSTYEEQYEQQGPKYDPQKQPVYDEYEQQSLEPSYDQYEQPPLKPSYDQYEQQTRQPSFDQFEQPHVNKHKEQPSEPPYDQYKQQPSNPPYDQYEQQPSEPPYDQYEQQPSEPPYDQYEQQPPELPYDQYKQQPSNPPYDQYEQQPSEPPYDQYEQQPPEPPYDQYKQQPSNPPYDQYEQQPSEPPYDHYEQQPSELPYDQYEQQPSEPLYDQYEQQPTDPLYDQYEQQPTELPYEQYKGQPSELSYDQYQGQSSEPPYDQYEHQPSEPPYHQYEEQPTEPPYDQYKQPSEPPYDQYKGQPPEHYDEYQGVPDQYGNYDYTYDQTAPVTDQTYPIDEQQNYIKETQPYDYNESLKEPYDDVAQNQTYSENVPYDGPEPIYPPEQNVYGDEQQVYESSAYAPQNLNVSQHEQFPSDYDYSQGSQPQNRQLSTQQDEALYEPETIIPHTQADLASRVNSEPAPKLNRVLESDPDSSVIHGPVSHEDLSAGKK